MSTPKIVTGDFTSIAVTLKVNGTALAIATSPTAAVVKARLVSTCHTQTLTAAIAQSNLTAGANWAAGLVIVVLAKADTVDIKHQGDALIEIQVDEASKPRTWFVPIKIIRGQIS